MPRAAIKRTTTTRRVPKTSYAARAAVVQRSRPPVVIPYGRSSIEPELKFFDTVVAGTALATTGVITSPSLNIVPQGTIESQRVGRKMVIKKIGIRFLAQFNSGTAESAEVLRIIVVLDRQANGATFAITDVLETASEGSFNNMANKNRFTILMDRYESINKTVDLGTNVNEHTQAWSWFKTCDIPIEYDNSATTGALTTQTSNNIAVFGITLNSTTISLGYTCRIRYYD